MEYYAFLKRTTFYWDRFQANRINYIMSSSLFLITLISTTILTNIPLDGILIPYSMTLLLAACLQVYSNVCVDSYIKKFSKELSNKLIFTGSLMLMVPFMESHMAPFMDKVYIDALASIGSRLVAGVLMHEKNVIFNHVDYDLNMKEAVFKTTVPTIIIKTAEIYTPLNHIAKWVLYSITKPISDFLAKSHFNKEEFLETATKKDPHKLPFYSAEYWLGLAADYFIKQTIKEQFLSLRIIFNATCRAVGEVTYLEPSSKDISKYISENIINKLGIPTTTSAAQKDIKIS